MSISWSQFGNIIIKNARAKRLPLVAQFELTSRCNLRCKMCYVCNQSKTSEIMKKEKSAKEWITLAEQARDAGALYLLLTGGEVFIRKDFREIYEAVSDMGFNIQIYSNGTLITPEIAKWLGKRPPSKLSITLYGASAETYKTITGDASAFEKTLRGIDLLKQENITLAMRTTIVKGNRNDVENMFDIAQQKGIIYGISQYISPRREGTSTDPVSERLTPNESMDYVQGIREFINKRTAHDQIAKTRKSSEQQNIMPTDIDSIVESMDNLHENSAFACSAGHCAFWVTWDGRMTPCGMMSEPVVDIFHKDFKDAWEELKEKCDRIPKAIVCENCENKVFCMTCPAKIKLETGDYNQCADYLCQLALLHKNSYESKKTGGDIE